MKCFGGNLCFEIIKAENVRNADVFGKSDPYCLIRVEQVSTRYDCNDDGDKINANNDKISKRNAKERMKDHKKSSHQSGDTTDNRLTYRTSTIDDTLNPHWYESCKFPIGDGKGELHIPNKVDPVGAEVHITLYDEDLGFRDDLLGSIDAPLRTENIKIEDRRPDGDDSIMQLPIIHRKVQKGTLYLKVWLQPNEKTAKEKLLDGTIDFDSIANVNLHMYAVGARNLHRADMFSEPYPYVQITVLSGPDLSIENTWKGDCFDPGLNPVWEQDKTYTLDDLGINLFTPDGGHLVVKVFDKGDDESSDDSGKHILLGESKDVIRIKEITATKLPSKPTRYELFYEDEHEGDVDLKFWVEPSKELGNLAKDASSIFKEVCEKANSPLRAKWTSKQYTQIIKQLSKTIQFIKKAAADWRIRPFLECTDEELEVGMSMVDTMQTAQDFQIQKEIKEEEKRQAREEHKKWVKEGWKQRTTNLKYERPNSTAHERWYYDKIHTTHNKMRRGQANPQLVFFKEQMFDTTMEEVCLGDLKIRREKALLVGEYILFCGNLRILDLANNYIDKDGIVTLAQNLNKHKSLKMLSLRRNQLADDGATFLCQCLGENSVLCQLDISDNRIGENGGNAIARMLMRNVGLKELYIQENIFGQAALANIKNAVSTRLIMKSNYEDPEDRRFEIYYVI